MTQIDSSAGFERNRNSASGGGSFESVRSTLLFTEGESSVAPALLRLNGIRQGSALSGEQAVDLQRQIDATGLTSRWRAGAAVAELRRVRDLVAATGRRDIFVRSRRARTHAERGL